MPNQQWEYKMLSIKLPVPKDAETRINHLGDDGWEAVSMPAFETEHEGLRTKAFMVLFKRAKAN